MSSTGDLHAHARIRNVAVDLFGQQGIRATTIRQIAEAASVSPGLVIHHFGSKDGLRVACDDWIMAELSKDRDAAVQGDEEAVHRLFEGVETYRPFIGYLVASIIEGGPGAERLFDQLCEMTESMYAIGVPAGTFRAPRDLNATSAMLVAMSLATSLMSGHIARRLGGPDLLDPTVLLRCSVAAAELYTHGMFADDSLLRAIESALTHETTE